MTCIVQAFPRLRTKHEFTHMCMPCATKPQTTYDTFARDFGERFVPVYRPQSMIDALNGSPLGA